MRMESSLGKLTTSKSHKVCRTVPGHFVQVMELVGNFGYSGADDRLVRMLVGS